MSDEWTREDQDKAGALRREVVADLQDAKRHNLRFLAWLLDKAATMALWIEREGRRLMRGS